MTGPRLQGRRIVVTRTREAAAGLVDLLHAAGAEAVVVPLIATVVIAQPDDLRRAGDELRAAPEPRWAAFTSATAVRLVLGVVDPEVFDGVHVAAVGRETAAALQQRGVEPDVVATGTGGAELAAAMAKRGVANARVWFPVAEGAGTALERVLGASGARVHRQDVYRVEMPAAAPERLRSALARPVDGLTLASGSAARNLVTALQGVALSDAVTVACIGESTARAAREAGLRNLVVAATPNAAGLVDVLAARLGAAQSLP